MSLIDDLAALLGTPFDEGRVESLLGVRGEELRTEYEPGHPEDERRYYVVHEAGVQFLVDDAGAIATIFCTMREDTDVRGDRWAFGNGVDGSSTRSQVRAAFGTPERSGAENPFAPGGWDRFEHPVLGLVHVEYKASGKGLRQLTLMRRDMRR